MKVRMTPICHCSGNYVRQKLTFCLEFESPPASTFLTQVKRHSSGWQYRKVRSPPSIFLSIFKKNDYLSFYKLKAKKN